MPASIISLCSSVCALAEFPKFIDRMVGYQATCLNV
jgi:hypothetical protein